MPSERIGVELNIGGTVTVTVRELHQSGYYLVAHAAITPEACRELAELLIHRAEECERPEHQQAMSQYVGLCGRALPEDTSDGASVTSQETNDAD